MKIPTKALVGGAIMAALAVALKFTSITTMEYILYDAMDT